MRGAKRGPLATSIASTLAIYGIAETLGLMLVRRRYGLPGGTFAAYAAAQWAFQAVLGAALYLGRSAFYIEKTGERLERINAANKITLFRISMLPSIAYLIMASADFGTAPVMIGALSVTFVTDLIDGKLSRALNQVTKMGRVLDSVSDYSLLAVVAVAYRTLRILPNWLFLLVFFRLFLHALGMLVILIVRGRVEPQPTALGKAAIATTMVLFALETLRLVLPGDAVQWLGAAEKATGAVVAASLLDKAVFFHRHVREKVSLPDGKEG